MAIAQPDFVSFEYGQDGTWTVALSPAQDVTGWTVTCTVRNQRGGTALLTKTIGSGITVTDVGNGVFVVTFTAADLALTYGPGAYTIQLHRTNVGSTYPMTDPAPLVINAGDDYDGPTLTNMGEYLAHRQASMTVTDSEAQQLIQILYAAEDLLESLCQRKFTYRTTLTEYYDGNGTVDFQLNRRPVTSITNLYLDRSGAGGTAPNAFPAETLLTAGTDYYLVIDSKFGDGLSYSGYVRRIGGGVTYGWPYSSYAGGGWPSNRYQPGGQLSTGIAPCPGCIKVTYQAGYRLIPYRIKLAVWNIATMAGQMAADGRLAQSESAEGHSVSFMPYADQAMMIGSVQQVVGNLRDNFVG